MPRAAPAKSGAGNLARSKLFSNWTETGKHEVAVKTGVMTLAALPGFGPIHQIALRS
jgi:hypothetical protein